MRRLSTIAAVVALITSPHGVSAQGSAVQTMPLPVLGIGGGISIPAGGIAKDRQPGFNLDGMAEFRVPSEPLGLRAEVLYQYFGTSKNALNASSANTVGFLLNVV